VPKIDLLDPKVENARKMFFRTIYGKETEGYVCLSFVTPGPRPSKGGFKEEFFHWPTDEALMLRAITSRVMTHTVYFCPHLFDEKKRQKEAATITPSAWADLDFFKPEDLLVQPTVTIESSPRRYQALWCFSEKVDPQDAQDLSKRIAYKHAEEGADRSGWDLTQLLRVPYTLNFKYDNGTGPPVVTIVEANPNRRYELTDFDEYPPTPGYVNIDIPMPDIPYLEGEAQQLLQSNRLRQSPTIWILFNEVPTSESWSELLWKFMLMLFEAGFDREQVFKIARDAGCNKYARDNRPQEQLWKEVCRAEYRYDLNTSLLVPNPEEMTRLLSEEEIATVANAEDTFVERYIKWASSLGDAAPQYHQAGAFVALSSLLAGSVRLPTSYGTVIPNIWFMILADTTLTRKTTAMDIAMDLVTEVDDQVVMATDGSIEGLLTSLATRPNRPSVFLRDEFSGLISQMVKKDYMAGMAELLTKLYDGKLQRRILRKETVEVRDPRLIVFGGGIKDRVCGALDIEMVSSGFMPRFVFITAESDLQRVRPVGPPTIASFGQREAIQEELTDIHAMHNRIQSMQIKNTAVTLEQPLTTDAVMSDEAWIRFNELEGVLLENGLKAEMPSIMTPVADRLAKSILKAALLICASRQKPDDNDTITIELLDILRAIKYGEQWYAHALDVMENVGKGTEEKRIDTIVQNIQRHPGGLPRSMLMQSYHLTARDANHLFETLEQRGLIRRQRQGKTEVIYPTITVIKETERSELKPRSG
jgi:hypothetical protein